MLILLSKAIGEVDLLFFSLFEDIMVMFHKMKVQHHLTLWDFIEFSFANLSPKVDKDFFRDGLREVFEVIESITDLIFVFAIVRHRSPSGGLITSITIDLIVDRRIRVDCLLKERLIVPVLILENTATPEHTTELLHTGTWSFESYLGFRHILLQVKLQHRTADLNISLLTRSDLFWLLDYF